MPRLDFSIVPNVSAWEVNEKCILYVPRVDHPLLDTVLKVDRNETEPLRPFYKSIPDLQPLCFAWKPVDLVSIEYQIFLETISCVFEMLRCLVQGYRTFIYAPATSFSIFLHSLIESHCFLTSNTDRGSMKASFHLRTRSQLVKLRIVECKSQNGNERSYRVDNYFI